MKTLAAIILLALSTPVFSHGTSVNLVDVLNCSVESDLYVRVATSALLTKDKKVYDADVEHLKDVIREHTTDSEFFVELTDQYAKLAWDNKTTITPIGGAMSIFQICVKDALKDSGTTL